MVAASKDSKNIAYTFSIRSAKECAGDEKNRGKAGLQRPFAHSKADRRPPASPSPTRRRRAAPRRARDEDLPALLHGRADAAEPRLAQVQRRQARQMVPDGPALRGLRDGRPHPPARDDAPRRAGQGGRLAGAVSGLHGHSGLLTRCWCVGCRRTEDDFTSHALDDVAIYGNDYVKAARLFLSDWAAKKFPDDALKPLQNAENIAAAATGQLLLSRPVAPAEKLMCLLQNGGSSRSATSPKLASDRFGFVTWARY